MGRDLPTSKGPPKGPAPLELGTGDRVALRATVDLLPGGEHEAAFLESGSGENALTLSKQGAGTLGRWLLDWARPRAKLKLWGIDGIAKECKVSRRTAYNWAAKEGFPPPLDVVGGNGPVWEADAVKAWVRLVHRPTKQKARRR